MRVRYNREQIRLRTKNRWLRSASRLKIGDQEAHFDWGITETLFKASPALLCEPHYSGFIRFDLDRKAEREQHVLKWQRDACL
jgi:hypothetical protein